MVDEESPWMDDGEETNMTTNMPDARVSQQEWDKLSLRYSDVSAFSLRPLLVWCGRLTIVS